MNIETRIVQGVTIIDIEGKITIGEGSAEIRKTIRSLVQSGQKKVLLNLGEVKILDSTGIGELVSSFTHVADQGGTLKLLNLTKRLKELLAIDQHERLTPLGVHYQCINI